MAQSYPRTQPVPIERHAERPARPRHNLPDPLTRLIGREREVTAVTALLATTRLLTGSGGCGKTRLAFAVATARSAEPAAAATTVA